MEISLRNLHTAFSYALSLLSTTIEFLVLVLVEEGQGVLIIKLLYR